ncbi:prolyl oligopeptidase, partial [Helicosporidium sp. ATCC 50920]
MRARVVEADTGVPYKQGEHQYYSRTEEGAQYRVHCRRRLPAGSGPQLETDGFAEAPEEVVLDENEEARAHKFYATGGVSPSPDGRLLAYSADTVGGEKFTLCVRDVATRAARLRRPIPNTTGAVEWSADGRWLFYLTRDALERPHKVWRHLLGSDPADDVCVFHEPDDTFYVGIDKSASERFIWIGTGSAVTSDARYIPADRPEAEPRLVLPRRQDVEYSVQDAPDGSFVLLLRDEGRPNSELVLLRRRDLQAAGPGGADPGALVTLVPHRQDVKLEHFDVWKRHVVLQERRRANQEAVVYDLSAADGPLAAGRPIQFDEPAYTLGVHKVGDFECPLLALYYAS